MALIICSECGSKVSDKAKSCPTCGAPIERVISPDMGVLRIDWSGRWALTDWDVDLFVNGNKIGSYSFKDGFSVDVPITSQDTEVMVKCGFRTIKHIFRFSPRQDYQLNLTYSRFSGAFGFEMEGENGTITTDHLSFGMGLLVFLFPLIGAIYAFCVKNKKPAVFQAAIIVAICGFLMGVIFPYAVDPYDTDLVLAMFVSIGAGGLLTILWMLSAFIGVTLI